MNENGYILNLYAIKNREPKIGERLKEILFLFLDNKKLSAYDCFKKINEQTKITYKNIHEYVKKLESLKMIEPLSKNNFDFHGKINYTLSSFGLFYIIKNYPYLSAKKELFLNYKSDELFNLFLYNYIQLSTLQNIEDEEIFKKIFRYLSECCKEIEKSLSWLSTFDKGENPFRENWIKELNNNLSTDFLTDTKNKKFNLINNDNLILASFPIVKHEQTSPNSVKKITINLENPTKESFIDQMSKIILYNSKIYLFNLCLNILRYNYEISKSKYKEFKSRYEVLFQDTQFVKYVNQAEKDIDKYFISFKNLTKK